MTLRLIVNFSFALIAFNLFTPAPLLADGPNLVLNSSFESGTTAPTSWTKGSWGSNISTFVYPVLGFDGAKAAQVTLSSYASGDAKWYFAPQAVLGGKTYYFSDYSLSGISTTIEARYQLSNGTFRYVKLGAVPGTNAWQKFSATTTAPAGSTSVTVFHYVNKNGSLTVDAYDFHEVSTSTPPIDPPPPPPTPTGTSTNLVANNSLETQSASVSTMPDKWQKGGWGTNSRTFTYPVAGGDGVRAAQVSMNSFSSGDAKWYFDPVSVIPGKEYVFSNSYQGTVPTSLVAQFQMANSTYLYSFLGNVPASSVWTSFTKNLIPPTDALKVTIFHVLASVGSLTVDNYVLKEAIATSTSPEPMVTLVFDDGLANQYQKAVPILDTAGLKATFVIITDRVGTSSRYMTWPQIKTLSAIGHDIGGHTRNHLSLITLSPSDAQSEIKGSYDALVAQGITPKSFAYPFGDENASVQQLVKDTGFIGARGVNLGFNDKNSNRYALRDQHIESGVTVEQVKVFIDQAIAEKKWLIFELHHQEDISTNQYSNTPTTLQGIVDYIKFKGIRAVTLKQGLEIMNQ